jgi:uncharacterized RDD family membrane protein YckC
MSTVPISTPFNISLDFEIAEFHKRLLAYFIDMVILLLYLVGMMRVLEDGFGLDSEDFYGAFILTIGVPMVLYSLIIEVVNNGQSLGKMALGIKVMSLDGGEPNISQYLIRWIFRFFEWLPLFIMVINRWILSERNYFLWFFLTGFFGLVVVVVIAISKKSQRLGDMAAGTAIVNTKIKLGLSDTIFQAVETKDYKVMFPEVMRLSDRDINSIKSVLSHTQKTGKYETAYRVSGKIKEVLKIDSGNYEVADFLEKLLEDYNYLATKE